MALRGYIKKGNPAPWMAAFPDQVRLVAPKKLLRPVRKRIRSESKVRAVHLRVYRIEARKFLAAARKAGWNCPVVDEIASLRNGSKYGHPISSKITEVHHMRGRVSGLLLDQRFWIAVSKQGHRWIHANVKESRKRGWICAAGQWNIFRTEIRKAEGEHTEKETARYL